MMKKVAVVIPIYKEFPNESEQLSLRRTSEILGDFPCIFLYPEGLDLTNYQNIFPQAEYFSLEKKHFESIKSYNKLLVSKFFYKIFKNYEYILICQTDVYVFENQLLAWCEKNYDYLGSPWLTAPPQVKEKVIFDLGKYAIGKVGNGGFSLRKIKIFSRYAFLTSLIFKIFPKNEDFIWCVIIPKIIPFIKFPDVETALHFAFELEPSKSFERIGRLPFAVHAWEKYEPDFWKKFI